jgi:dolichol-phosphate mannosyltransferase
MDADLQHPPEDVPRMFQKLAEDRDAQFVLGTRYGSGSMSVDSSWPLYRQIISKGARSLGYYQDYSDSVFIITIF